MDSHHSQGVWNLPHRVHLYLIIIIARTKALAYTKFTSLHFYLSEFLDVEAEIFSFSFIKIFNWKKCQPETKKGVSTLANLAPGAFFNFTTFVGKYSQWQVARAKISLPNSLKSSPIGKKIPNLVTLHIFLVSVIFYVIQECFWLPGCQMASTPWNCFRRFQQCHVDSFSNTSAIGHFSRWGIIHKC